MTARRPDDEPLVGRFIPLSPLPPRTSRRFRAIGRPEVFAGGFGGGPAGLPVDDEAFDGSRAPLHGRRRRLPFAVRVRGGDDDGTVIGATKLGDLDLANESAHIGWTAFDPRVWGTA